MKRHLVWLSLIVVLGLGVGVPPSVDAATGWRLVGWNNLGMHCDDADFSVFSTLPPYNTIDAQLIDPTGQVVADPTGITVTYEAIADPAGSVNTTSVGKSNFWQYAQALFGLGQPLPADTGLTGVKMPGNSNQPQPMTYVPAHSWFEAEGIPITPYDDSGAKNTYPMMRLVARDAAGNVLATTDIVLPVSDEMNCKLCHTSGSDPAAQPVDGWVNDPNPERDYRLNILRIHDDRRGNSPSYQQALAAFGYNTAGLYPTVSVDGKPILCATCHSSNALATAGWGSIPPLTSSIHSLHATVIDPATGMTMNDSNNRSACYRCHPGSTTKCLRGAMGAAVAADGSLAMQCQSCHGPMSAVGDPARQGWLSEPVCQSCHTGTATHNNGQIRYTTVFDSSGQPRVAVDQTFATTPNAPAAGYSLYRYSSGHGGLQCEACHGSTHAVFPSTHLNDNVQSIELQGHKGMLVECVTCHVTQPQTVTGGPHGMHPLGQDWVSQHHDVAEHNPAQCQTCHGTDYRGTVLSRAKGPRTVTAFGTKQFWQGFQIGCYTCHNGPSSDDASGNHPAQVADATASTSAGVPANIQLVATDADGNALTLRVVSQPEHGTAGLSGTVATYYPDEGFAGNDSFTFAAWDGSTDSNLGTVSISVSGGSTCTITPAATVPSSATVGQAVTFQGSATTSGCSGNPTFDWNFGDGSAHSAQATITHTYSTSGTFTWQLTVSVGTTSANVSGSIAVTSGCSAPTITTQPANVTIPRGGRASLTVVASGSGQLTYQWYRGSSGSTEHPISGATSSSYRTPQLTRTTSYWVRVRNACGSVNSATATVTVGSGDQVRQKLDH
ncbi:MAG: PKD domain-containing protein [Acidobacteriota bacterium]